MQAGDLSSAIRRALDARAAFFERMRHEETDAYRLFHGTVEGCAGLTIDRYADLVLVQTFRAPLDVDELRAIETELRASLGFEFRFVWNHRAKAAGETFERWQPLDAAALVESSCRELGVRYAIRPRHRGLDPWLFLDLRAGRRHLQAICREKSVLNLFAYTGAAGICALASGAREACNVDFARSSLDVALRHAELNALTPGALVNIVEDCFPVMWQLAGVAVKGRGSQRCYTQVAPRRFDIVFLDPPAWSKGPFGAVDVENDYPSLFKPALACAEDGGVVIATNHVARVDPERWRDVLERCARKAGRPLGAIETIEPDPDFPSFDGRKPLKIAICRL
jgi:23S rRNA (cytosine1962-C5)-methyltransferase